MKENYAGKSFYVKYYKHLKNKKLFMKELILNLKETLLFIMNQVTLRKQKTIVVKYSWSFAMLWKGFMIIGDDELMQCLSIFHVITDDNRLL